MSPRFTRNSDRPRASDRTMVDTEDARTRLPSFQNRLASSPSADEPHGWQTSQSKTSPANRGAHLQQWARSRDQNLLALRSRRSFFLDIPFCRTHCPGIGPGGYPLYSPSPYGLWFAFGLPQDRVNYPVMGNRIDGQSLLRQAKEEFASAL